MSEATEIQALREDLRGYHNDVKRRMEVLESEVKEHRIAIHGIPGDDTVPGLNVEVQSLRGFRERVRLGLGCAWALLTTLITIVWKGK